MRLRSGFGSVRREGAFGITSIFAAIAAFLALIQFLSIAFGVVRLRLNQPLALAVVAISIFLSWLFANRFREPAAAPAAEPRHAHGKTRLVDGALRAAAVGVLLWAGWVWLQLWIIAWLRQPLGWDPLWYHIPAIHQWALRGHVAFVPLDPQLADAPFEVLLAGWLNFPMGVELSSFFAHSLTGSSRLVDACNLWYWPLAFAALVLIATRLGARGIWRWLAGGLLFGASLFVAQSATAYIDPGFGAGVIGSLAAALVFVFDEGRTRWWSTVLLGANLGLMLGAKGVGLPFAAVLLFTAGVGALWSGGLGHARVSALRLALCASVMLAIGGYWYIRNAVNTGNPIYPIQLQIGHKVLIQGYDVSNYGNLDWVVRPVLEPYPPWSRTFVAWLQLDGPAAAGVSGGRYATAGGLGYIWLLGGIPAVIYLWVLLIRRRDRRRLLEYGFLTLSVLLLLSVTTIKWQARYTYWLHGLGLPAIAVVLSDAAARWRRDRRHLITAGLALGVIGIAVWESSRVLSLEWQTGRDPDSDDTVFLSRVQLWYPEMEEMPGFSDLLAADRVARGPWSTNGGMLFNGVLSLPLGKREIAVLPLDPSLVQLEQLRRQGIEWVFWDVEDPASAPPALEAAAAERYVYERYGGVASFRVYRIGAAEPDATARLDPSHPSQPSDQLGGGGR